MEYTQTVTAHGGFETMKEYRITYTMEMFISAQTQDDAQHIFDTEVDVYDLRREFRAEFVNQINIEEI
jgi:hypothetical protein